jgi:2-keto-3-deoxy-L-rhamnonate aldolase RhmA
MPVSFRKRLMTGDTMIGALMQMPLPEVAEIYQRAGYDWLFLDVEHSPMDVRAVIDILMAVDRDIPVVVRVPWNDEAWIKRILDTGATGVVLPLINTAKDAAFAVSRCRYPPVGERSVGISRAHGYGQSMAEYLASANDDIAVIIQIEHIEAVRNIEAILDVEGIDGVFVGPFDLSGSMGKPGQIDDEDVRAAISLVVGECEKRGIARCIYAHTPEHARKYIAEGYQVIGLATDYIVMARAVGEALKAVRG